MKQIMTYHCSSLALMTLANSQSIQLIAIHDSQLNCSLASILKGKPDHIQDNSSIDHSIMILSGFTSKEMDSFLSALKQRNIRCEYKAMLTPYNAKWSVRSLLKEMEKEQQNLKS